MIVNKVYVNKKNKINSILIVLKLIFFNVQFFYYVDSLASHDGDRIGIHGWNDVINQEISNNEEEIISQEARDQEEYKEDQLGQKGNEKVVQEAIKKIDEKNESLVDVNQVDESLKQECNKQNADNKERAGENKSKDDKSDKKLEEVILDEQQKSLIKELEEKKQDKKLKETILNEKKESQVTELAENEQEEKILNLNIDKKNEIALVFEEIDESLEKECKKQNEERKKNKIIFNNKEPMKDMLLKELDEKVERVESLESELSTKSMINNFLDKIKLFVKKNSNYNFFNNFSKENQVVNKFIDFYNTTYTQYVAPNKFVLIAVMSFCGIGILYSIFHKKIMNKIIYRKK